jgi:perosamine synthetase
MSSNPPRRIAIALPSTGDDEWQAVREPIFSGWLTQGPKVAAFERAFAARHGVPHALATTSCTTALHLALLGLGIGPGDEVIVPAFTWVATANAVLYCGAQPVLCDVDRRSFNIDPADAARRVTPRTRAVIAVHLFGLCADMDGLRDALPPGVAIVEDAACAAGAALAGRPAGGLGAAAAFSFHPRKSITTGEGGMVTTSDPEVASRIDVLRNHGASVSEEIRHRGPRPYLLPDFDVLGYNYRMTDLQASVGLAQLGKLDRFIEERRRWAAWYGEALADLPWLRTPAEPGNGAHAWQSYVCSVDQARAPMPRNALMERLQERGIATRPGTHAIHMLGVYRDRYGLRPDDLPAARDCDRDSLAIPLHNRMSAEDYAYVAEALHDLRA